VGASVGVFGSSKWAGVQIGGGWSVGATAGALWYDQIGASWEVKETSECLCAAFRAGATYSTLPISLPNIGIRQQKRLMEKVLRHVTE